MRFLDVKTDFAFKKVFGSEQSKDILISFLNAIVYSNSARKITAVTIVDPYNIPLLKGMKDTYVDVKAILDDGSLVIIEMQVLNHPGLEKRILYNAARNYSVQLKSGEDYTLLNPVIALTLVDFTLFTGIDHHTSRFKLIEKACFIEYSDDIELIFVELPKFSKAEEDLADIHDQWIYFIKNAGSLEYVPKDMGKECVKAFELINEARMSAAELEAQHKRKEFLYIQRTSIELAKTQGIAQGKRETAIKARQAGLSVPLICEITGLEEEAVRLLLQSAPSNLPIDQE